MGICPESLWNLRKTVRRRNLVKRRNDDEISSRDDENSSVQKMTGFFS